jgi:hypothetical protein
MLQDLEPTVAEACEDRQHQTCVRRYSALTELANLRRCLFREERNISVRLAPVPAGSRARDDDAAVVRLLWLGAFVGAWRAADGCAVPRATMMPRRSLLDNDTARAGSWIRAPVTGRFRRETPSAYAARRAHGNADVYRSFVPTKQGSCAPTYVSLVGAPSCTARLLILSVWWVGAPSVKGKRARGFCCCPAVASRQRRRRRMRALVVDRSLLNLLESHID